MAKTAASKAQTTSNALRSRTLILDNGAYSIKAGFATHDGHASNDTQCQIIPNVVARSARDKITYVGSQLDKCDDFGELTFRRPVEKGFIVNWESQKAVWESSILGDQSHGLACDPHDTNLILTESPHAPTALQKNTDEIVFEGFEFANYYRTIGPSLCAYASRSPGEAEPAECLLVVDCGHSHTTITPLLSGHPLHSACRRLDLGGKVLTNLLKDFVSSRQFELQREFFLVEQMKEDACFVCEDTKIFNHDLERCWKGGWKDPRKVDTAIVKEYVLPDYEKIKRGFLREHDPTMSKKQRLGIDNPQKEDFVVLGNERFTVPEVLFTPTDLGMSSPGIAGMILDSLQALPTGLWQAFLANIVVVGGTSRLPGFVTRLESELRKSLDERFVLCIYQTEDPVKHIWQGGARLAQSDTALKQKCVSRAEYLEHGDTWLRRMFAGKTQR